VTAVAREGRVDLEAVERALRAAVLEAGGKALEQLLESVGVGRRDTPVLCPRCRAVMASKGVQEKRVLTLLGEVRFARSRFVCPRCATACFPGDEALGIMDTSRSPGVQRLEAHFGAKQSFKEAAEDLHLAAGIEVSAKDAERVSEHIGEEIEQWTRRERRKQRREEAAETGGRPIETLYVKFDGTGIPMTPKELVGRRGKQPDGRAKTREVKLGCVFTQTLCDGEGHPCATALRRVS